MKYQISRELFETVMEEKFDVITFSDGITAEQLGFGGGRVTIMSYNDFFFKCKEWAWDKGFSLNTEMAISHITRELCYKTSIKPTEYSAYKKVADTEQQSVFDACEWILENK